MKDRRLVSPPRRCQIVALQPHRRLVVTSLLSGPTPPPRLHAPFLLSGRPPPPISSSRLRRYRTLRPEKVLLDDGNSYDDVSVAAADYDDATRQKQQQHGFAETHGAGPPLVHSAMAMRDAGGSPPLGAASRYFDDGSAYGGSAAGGGYGYEDGSIYGGGSLYGGSQVVNTRDESSTSVENDLAWRAHFETRPRGSCENLPRATKTGPWQNRPPVVNISKKESRVYLFRRLSSFSRAGRRLLGRGHDALRRFRRRREQLRRVDRLLDELDELHRHEVVALSEMWRVA